MEYSILPAASSVATRTYKVQLIAKAEIRRFTLAYPTQFSVLRDYIENLFFTGQPTLFTLKYEDNEKDLVTVANDNDLQIAWQLADSVNSYLRLFVEPQSQPNAQYATPYQPAPNYGAPAPTYGQQPTYAPPPPYQQSVAPGLAPAQVVAFSTPQFHTRGMDRLERRSARHERKAEKYQARADFICDKGGILGAFGERRMQRKADRQQCKADKAALKADYKMQKNLARKGDRCTRFVADVTCPKNTRIDCGVPFVKTWRVRNESQYPWPAGAQLLFCGKKRAIPMGAPERIALAPLRPGDSMDLSVNFVSPAQPGKYSSFWLIVDGNRVKIGPTLKVKIIAGNANCSSSSSDDDRR